MTYHRTDIVECAIGVLDQFGIADLSMRRIAGELGIQPSALYHHFASKQLLLAAVADEILARRQVASSVASAWEDVFADECRALREAMLVYRDGGEVVATVHAMGLGAVEPYERLVAAVHRAQPSRAFAQAAARTATHFVFGHVVGEQTHRQANSAGAIDADPFDQATDESFDLGLAFIVAGIAQQLAAAGYSGQQVAH